MMIEPRPYRLKNPVQHYAWGTRNGEAFIPRLLGFHPDPGVPYAELWMGAHSRGSSAVLMDSGEIPLRDLIRRFRTETLGKAVSDRFHGELPFLFKVISVGESLSIQAHPDKEQAARLHKRDPDNYPDANHKPEVAIALDSLDLLAGLRPRAELAGLVENYPEIARFLEWPASGAVDRKSEKSRPGMPELIRTLLYRMIQDPPAMEKTIEELSRGAGSSPRAEADRLFIQLREKYPGPDPGLILLYFLRRNRLDRGRAIFMKPGVPHAYLHGNIVEVMANSDNVIRAGLTPKFTDIQALAEILDFQPDIPLEIEAVERDGERNYPVPVDEFEVSELVFRPGGEKRIISGDVPEILLVFRGGGRVATDETGIDVSTGDSCFIPALLPAYRIKAAGEMRVFRVRVPIGA